MTKNLKHIWTSQKPESLPDFIIGGAMKSGTTSLHAILNSHPDIGISHNELGFFDIDNLLQHPDFNFYDKINDKWINQSMQDHPELLWKWYYEQFEGLKKTASVIGEDSTTYLCSEIAAQRIALQKKPIKLIFILRHPTKRTVSNYLHLLKSGRAIYTLEDTLKFNPNSIIGRSLYKAQLENYYKYIPFERIKIVLFEDLIHQKDECLREISDFLDIDFNKFDASVFDTHSNKTRISKSLKLQLFRNRLLRKSGNYRYSNFLPLQPKFQSKLPFRYRLIDKIHKKINPKTTNYSYKVAPGTKEFLDAFFKIEFQGFDELVKKEVYSKWFENK